MFSWLPWRHFGTGVLRDVPRTTLLVDFHHIQKCQAELLEILEERGFIDRRSPKSLLRYLRRHNTSRLIFRPRERRDSLQPLRCFLDLSPALLLSLEPLPGYHLAYTGRIELPEQSRLRYEAVIGAVPVLDAKGLFDFHVSSSERPLQTKCPVCRGRGRVDCPRCNGRGYYVSKSGRRYACGNTECRRGHVKCRYCKGERWLGLSLFRQEDRLCFSVPKALEHASEFTLYAGSRRIERGVHPLFRRLSQLRNKHKNKADDYLSRAEEEFEKRLDEMEEFLRLELECASASLDAVRVRDAQWGEGLSDAKTLVFEKEGDQEVAWSRGNRLVFLEDSESGLLELIFSAEKEGQVFVALAKGASSPKELPRRGVLVSKRGLRTYFAQKKALDYWRRQETLVCPVKRALLLPGRISTAEARPVAFFHDARVGENPQQRAAVEKALNPACPLVCIQGPPGTGKTSVIVEIAKQHLTNGRGKILISSQSNLAVDNVLERLAGDKGISMLRLGNPERISAALLPFSLASLTERLAKSGQGSDGFLRTLIRFLFSLTHARTAEAEDPLDLLEHVKRSVQVIGATCVGSDEQILHLLGHGEPEERIGMVVVDEVGRSTPMEMLIPMQHADKVVLVGDHRQLPPVLNDEIRDAWKKSSREGRIEESVGARSLLEELMKSLPAVSRTVLCRQYRMHPEIANFVSSVFYPEERLENAVSAEERSLPLPGFPAALSYHSTAAMGELRFERQRRGSLSRENEAEAELVVKLLSFLDRHSPEEGISAGVISFYMGQVENIRKRVRGSAFSRLRFDPQHSVSTLDAFQGQEEDVIILSLVRCPRRPETVDAGWYRFFLDVRRLNVALSRARKRLMIVGDIERLLQVRPSSETEEGLMVLRRLIDYVRANDLELRESAL